MKKKLKSFKNPNELPEDIISPCRTNISVPQVDKNVNNVVSEQFKHTGRKRKLEENLVIVSTNKNLITPAESTKKSLFSTEENLNGKPQKKKIGISRRFKYGKIRSLDETSKSKAALPNITAIKTFAECSNLQKHADIVTLMALGNDVSDKKIKNSPESPSPNTLNSALSAIPSGSTINRAVGIVSHPSLETAMFDIDFQIEPSLPEVQSQQLKSETNVTTSFSEGENTKTKQGKNSNKENRKGLSSSDEQVNVGEVIFILTICKLNDDLTNSLINKGKDFIFVLTVYFLVIPRYRTSEIQAKERENICNNSWL